MTPQLIVEGQCTQSRLEDARIDREIVDLQCVTGHTMFGVRHPTKLLRNMRILAVEKRGGNAFHLEVGRANAFGPTKVIPFKTRKE